MFISFHQIRIKFIDRDHVSMRLKGERFNLNFFYSLFISSLADKEHEMIQIIDDMDLKLFLSSDPRRQQSQSSNNPPPYGLIDSPPASPSSSSTVATDNAADSKYPKINVFFIKPEKRFFVRIMSNMWKRIRNF